MTARARPAGPGKAAIPFVPLPRLAIRRLACGLLTSALLLTPLPAPAVAGGACLPPAHRSGMIGDIRTVISGEAANQPPFTLRLTFRMQASGAVRGDGEIRIHGGAGAAVTTAIAPYAPVIIAAHQTIGTICADLDGDGVAGPTQLSLDFDDPRSGARIPVVLRTSKRDIDAGGAYAAVLQVGPEPVTGDVRVRLAPDRERRHRRR